MATLSSQIENIELKIKALIQEKERLKSINARQESIILDLKIDNNELIETLKLREEEIATLKTANAILGSDDYKTKTKLKINALIREIDQCINQLAS